MKNLDSGQQFLVWGSIFAGILLLYASGERTHDYYELLRWLVAAVGAASAYICYEHRNLSDGYAGWAIFALVGALLFNPFSPPTFERSTWESLDILFGIGFLIQAGYAFNNPKVPHSRFTGDFLDITTTEEIVREYGKVIENLHSKHKDKYPAMVFPISLLPASKADIRRAIDEALTLTTDGDQNYRNSLEVCLGLLDSFVSDEKANELNRRFLLGDRKARVEGIELQMRKKKSPNR